MRFFNQSSISCNLMSSRVWARRWDWISARSSPLPPLADGDCRVRVWTKFSVSISSLKVVWHKDHDLDEAIEDDKEWRLCTKVVKEVLNEPGQVIPLRYLEKRRERLRLQVKVKTFLGRYPGLFNSYLDWIKLKTEPIPFVHPNNRLCRFLEEEKHIKAENEHFLVAKWCKLLMMSRDRVVNADKLVHVKWEFGFPDNFLCGMVPKYPQLFRLVGSPGEENHSWNWAPGIQTTLNQL